MSGLDLVRARRLLTAVGKVGDAASMAGSLHAKADAIYAAPRVPQTAALGVVSYPNGTTGAVGAAEVPWPSWSAWAQLVPAGTLGPLHIIGLTMPNNNAIYAGLVEMSLAVGGAGAEVELVRTFITPIINGSHSVSVPDVVVANGVRIAYRFRCPFGASAFGDGGPCPPIFLMYYPY